VSPEVKHPLICICFWAVVALIAGTWALATEHRLKRKLGKDYEGPLND
jgi:hypothetical protein